MVWFALSDHESSWFSARGHTAARGACDLFSTGPDALLTRGSLVVETRFPVLRRPKPLVYFQRSGACPFHLSIQALPGGGLTLILDQGGDILHRVFNYTQTGRADVLRLTYSWDAPRRFGQIALERGDQDHVDLVHTDSPRPMRIRDLRALMHPGDNRFVAPEVLFMAASTAMEPVGPTPTLAADTPIATPGGYRAVSTLARGDLVLNADHAPIPVLHTLTRTVPARGSFAPVRLRAPYFALKQDIVVAPKQNLVLSGSEVEYLFGHEAVLIQAGHLSGGASVLPMPTGRFITYTQLVLPDQETLDVAGARIESVNIARIRRKSELLAASLLANLDRATLPEHGLPGHPVLKAFDAVTLAEYRAA